MKDRGRTVRRLRNAAAIIGVAGALIAGGVGTARADQGATLDPGYSATFSTWLLGGTELCFQAVAPPGTDPFKGANFTWNSGPSSYSGTVYAGATQPYCPSWAFLGFPVTVTNNGPLTLKVWEHNGP